MTRRRTRVDDAPLLAWGEALRARKMRQAQVRRRMLVTGLGIGVVLQAAILPPAPRMVWNASASAPIGLYLVRPGSVPATGDMVVARIPGKYEALAAARRYLPATVPLVKRVAAKSGDEVCALGPHVFVEGRPVAERLRADTSGRAMPWWSGCTVLRARQVFLLTDSPSSFDGRYFGVSEGSDVIGTARLVWRR